MGWFGILPYFTTNYAYDLP
ncbi:uncharacterized protein G2W53_007143 [Senna tora]|uniref:Uncharacterized protein n=1 Tax=Senna tora TaxID=362788 RepID=A0A835CDA1_9FABA|nr:uncharacterized protein G2W53_007143 [Senna tora]